MGSEGWFDSCDFGDMEKYISHWHGQWAARQVKQVRKLTTDVILTMPDDLDLISDSPN